MVKKLYVAGTVLFAFIACNKIDQRTEEPMDAPTEWKASIQATKENDQTKALSESGTTITASWEIGDVVYILSTNGNTEYGTMTAQSNGASTTLTGTITKTMTVGKSYILRYLQKGQDYLYLVSQKGTLEDIAKRHDISEATVTVKSINDNVVSFEETVAHFESKISITKFTFDRTVKWVGIYSSNLKTYVQPGYSTNYSFISLEPDSALQTAYIAMSNKEDKKAVYSFLAKGTDGLYYVATKKVQLENGKNYVTNVTLHAMPDYVDMGIQRGGYSVCWATRNLGAVCPSRSGNYYAWAETTPKTTYSWDEYPYGSYSWITKYDPDRTDQGVVDGLSTLLPEDDAATVTLGSGWRTPNLVDFQDLLSTDKIDVLYAFAGAPIDNEGRWGYVFMSKVEGFAGKFIFLPRTGYYKDDAYTNNNYGYYWTNNIDQTSWTSSSFANTLYFTNSLYSSPSTSRMERAYGLPVRPVYLK